MVLMALKHYANDYANYVNYANVRDCYDYDYLRQKNHRDLIHCSYANVRGLLHHVNAYVHVGMHKCQLN